MSREPCSQAYQVNLGHFAKPWMVPSSNSRNRIRIPSSPRALRHQQACTRAHGRAVDRRGPSVGFVLIDDIVQLIATR